MARPRVRVGAGSKPGAYVVGLSRRRLPEAHARLVELGLTQTEIARAVHKEKSTISKCLRLTRLPENVRTFIDAGVLNGKQGQELHRYLHTPPLFTTMLTRAKAGWFSRKLATARSQATA